MLICNQIVIFSDWYHLIFCKINIQPEAWLQLFCSCLGKKICLPSHLALTCYACFVWSTQKKKQLVKGVERVFIFYVVFHCFHSVSLLGYNLNQTMLLLFQNGDLLYKINVPEGPDGIGIIVEGMKVLTSLNNLQRTSAILLQSCLSQRTQVHV